MSKIYADRIRSGQTIVWQGITLKVKTVTPIYSGNGKTIKLTFEGSKVPLVLSILKKVELV